MGRTIPDEEACERLAALPGWQLEGHALRSLITFESFAEAVAFVVRVGFAAEAADHHPEVRIAYRRVTLTYTTHSEGGLTEKDFAGAAEASRLAARLT